MKLMDKRKKMFRRIRNRSILERIIILVVITTLILLVVSGYIDQVRAETPKEQVTVTSSSTSSETPKVVEKPAVVVPEVTKAPEVVKDTIAETKKVCNIDKLLKGKFVGQKDLILSKYSCSQARKLLALSGVETSFCTKGVGKNNNCFAINGKNGFLKFTNVQEAIVQANKYIGKYLNMTDSELLKSKSYCTSGCESWENSLSYFLNLAK